MDELADKSKTVEKSYDLNHKLIAFIVYTRFYIICHGFA